MTGSFGVRWSPENFLERAVMVGHPFKEFFRSSAGGQIGLRKASKLEA